MQKLKEDIKKRIFEAGKARFRNNGFNNTSMRDIANDAGVSTGNIYRYFLTKSHLLDEILNELEEEIYTFLNSIPEDYNEIKGEVLFNIITSGILDLYERRESEVKILLNCTGQKQFIVFNEKILNMFTEKIMMIGKSINHKHVDRVLCAALARSLFEGLIYILCNNELEIEELKKKVYIYVEIMVSDLDKRINNVTKKVCL